MTKDKDISIDTDTRDLKKLAKDFVEEKHFATPSIWKVWGRKFKNRRFWTEGYGSLFLAVLLALTIRWAFFEAYVIPSGSMYPSLLTYDYIFVNKMIYGLRAPFSEKWFFRFTHPKRGEVVVFKYPMDKKTFFIKRVVAIAGDTLEYKEGLLFVNGEAVKRLKVDSLRGGMRFLRDKDFQTEGTYFDMKDNYDVFEETLGEHTYDTLLRQGESFRSFGPITVPEGALFVMGDNRDNSNDSRIWGFLAVEYVLGRASMIWLSCGKPLSRTTPGLSRICNPLTLRWPRLFHFIH